MIPAETASPVTEQTAVTEQASSEADVKAADLLAEMSFEEKVYQLFITKPEQLSPDEEFLHEYPNTKDELKKYPVGGLIYFERNLSSREQCEEMIKNVKKRTKTGLFISVGEEASVGGIKSNWVKILLPLETLKSNSNVYGWIFVITKIFAFRIKSLLKCLWLDFCHY